MFTTSGESYAERKENRMTEDLHDTENDLGDYVPVAERIRQFKAKHPEGTLQPADPSRPYAIDRIQTADGVRTFVVYAAAAYRTPDDPRPGIGIAWEPFPGLSDFTHNSELMNAETSAWGRAIRAAQGDDETTPIATAEEVAARRSEKGQSALIPNEKLATKPQVTRLRKAATAAGIAEDHLLMQLSQQYGDEITPERLTRPQASHVIEVLEKLAADKKAKAARKAGE